MKISGTTTPLSSTGWEAPPNAQAKTNFQQLVQQLEHDMWSGAKAGRNDVQALPNPSKAPVQPSSPSQTTLVPPAEDGAVPNEITSIAIDASSQVGPAMPLLTMQATPASTPLLQAKQSDNGAPASTPQAFFTWQPCILNAAKAPVADRTVTVRTQPQAAPAHDHSDRLSLLPGTNMPAVVVRYTGSSGDLPQLKRALQDVLRRHGIHETSLTINGFDAIARIEHGADHGR